MGKKKRNKEVEAYMTELITEDTKKIETDSKTSSKPSGYKSYYSHKKNFDYKGRRNKTLYPEFTNLCKYSQSGLKTLLEKKLLAAGYTEVISDNGYIYAKGSVPVLLTAHMDTVHKDNVKDFYEYFDRENNQHIISSPQGIGGDDRCGVYMILEIIKTHKCSILFCEDEESGGIGSSKFCRTELVKELSALKYFIELDRANGTDAVFYDCDNKDFTEFILDNTGYEEEWGSFSDISTLSPVCGIASVNLSCGYYNAHTTSEYVIMEEMMNTIEVVKKLLDVECEKFKYVEKEYSYYRRSYSGYGCYGSYDGYDAYDDYYSSYYGRYDSCGYYDTYHNDKLSHDKQKEIASGNTEERSLFIYIYDETMEDILTYVANGTNIDEAFGKFFRNNPCYCFSDIYDWDWYDNKVYDDGWYCNI